MRPAFAYKGAMGKNAAALIKHVFKAVRFIDPMCGSCTLPLMLQRDLPRIELYLSDLSYYAAVNAHAVLGTIYECDAPPPTHLKYDGFFSASELGYWNDEFRGYIDAVLQQNSLVFEAAVSRVLLASSYRGATWTDKDMAGRVVAEKTADDARAELTAALETIRRRRVARRSVADVAVSDWIRRVDGLEPRKGDVIYIEPPFPWPNEVASDIYNFYVEISSIMAQRPVDEMLMPPFDASVDHVCGAIDRWRGEGATVILMKQNHCAPDHQLYIDRLGSPTMSLPIRGRAKAPEGAREDYFVCRS